MALLDSNFWKISTLLYFLCTRNRFFCLEMLTFKMVIKVSAWKPEVNENVTLSTVNFAINDHHRLWPYNLCMPISKWLSLIEAFVISQNFGKFHENLSLKHKFRSFQQSELCVASRFLFVWVKRSTCTLKLNKISRFNMVTKNLDEFVIFHQNFWQKLSSSFGKTSSFVRGACEYKDKVYQAYIYRKNNTCTSCVFNGFKYILGQKRNTAY